MATIPSEEEFNKSIELLKTFDAVELIEKYWELESLETCSYEEKIKRTLIEKPHYSDSPIRGLYYDYIHYGEFKIRLVREDVESFLNDYYELFTRKYNKIHETPALIWLTSQPAYKAAEKNIFGPPHTPKDHAYFFELTLSKLLKCESEKRLESLVRHFIDKTHGRFYHVLLLHLKNYFYSDFEQYLTALKKREIIAKKAKKYIDELVKIESLVAELEGTSKEFHISLKHPTHNKINRLLVRAGLEIEDMTLLPRLKPVRKGDATARERLLIFNLWKSFKPFKQSAISSGKRNYVTAISHLMYLDGIDNPIGQRAIEKLIQGWKSRRSDLQNSDLSKELWDERQKLKKKYRVHIN